MLLLVMKYFIICFFLLETLYVFGQNTRTISIDAGNACAVNLSEIAEKVTPIILEEPTGGTQNILLTSEYLFVVSISSIVQYNMSGKFIRKIDFGGYITDNLTSDTIKKLLYMPVGDKIKCYNYSGNFKKEYSLKTFTAYCLYHNDVLWVLSFIFQPDKTTDYYINKINLTTGEIITLPFKIKDEPLKTEDGGLIQSSSLCRLILNNDQIYASFNFDNTIYKIRQDKVIPFIQWNISPSAQSVADRKLLGTNGFAGDNLMINYRRNDLLYIYLENFKNGKKYNMSNIIDDVFYTRENCKIKPLEQENYFYFIKDKSEIIGNNIGNFPLKNGPVVFIVKTK